MRRLRKIAGWSIPSADANVHASMESFYDALTEHWYGSDPPRRTHSGFQYNGRASGCDIAQRRIAKESLTVEWALDLEGPLFGQVLNGGLFQFVDNCPFVLDETALMLSTFGPKAACELFWGMVGPLAAQMQGPRQSLIAANGIGDDRFWEKVNDLIQEHFTEVVDPALEDLWMQRYVGEGDLFGQHIKLGETDPSEPWATTIARNILGYAIKNAHELGVQLTYDDQTA